MASPGAQIGGLVTGTPQGAILGHMLGRKKRRSQGGSLTQAFPDSWKQLMAGPGGQDAGDALQKLLANFQGSPQDMEEFMQRAGPFLASGQAQALAASPAYKYIQDQGNWDLGAMGAYGPAAGQIGQGARRAERQGEQDLAARGLGRSAATASMRQMAQQGATTQQGNLFSQLFQQAQQNRMQSAGNALDAHRLVAQMALGQQPTPRTLDPNAGFEQRMQQMQMLLGGLGGIAGGAGALVGGLTKV